MSVTRVPTDRMVTIASAKSHTYRLDVESPESDILQNRGYSGVAYDLYMSTKRQVEGYSGKRILTTQESDRDMTLTVTLREGLQVWGKPALDVTCSTAGEGNCFWKPHKQRQANAMPIKAHRFFRLRPVNALFIDENC